MGTTRRGFPYPEPSDPIAAGADAIKALAQQVDLITYDPGSAAFPFGAVVPATARLYAQTGVYNASTNASGALQLVFPHPFTTQVVSVSVLTVATAAYLAINGRAAINLSGVNMSAFTNTGVLIANAAVDFTYTVIGW